MVSVSADVFYRGAFASEFRFRQLDNDHAIDLDSSFLQVLLDGRGLKKGRVNELVEQLKSGDADLRSRLLLLGYCWVNPFRKKTVKARSNLILWFIENHPTKKVSSGSWCNLNYGWGLTDQRALRKAEKLWLKHIERAPTDPIVLCNAAWFFHHINKDDKGARASSIH